MAEKSLVSIITPCYNGEKFLSRYFDALLNQTYSNLELIFVNDGSTDKTEEVVFSYKEKLDKKGIKLKYISKKNAGQALAVNDGLKLFTGDYLCWPDSDDFLSPTYFEKCVLFLEEHKDKGFVYPQSNMIREDELDKVYSVSKKSKADEKDLFLSLICDTVGITYASGLARASMFLDVNPNREIGDSKSGQNLQLLLPLIYKYGAGFVEEPLYNCVIRANSFYHSNDNYERKLKYSYMHEELVYKLLEKIDMPKSEREEYAKKVKTTYLNNRVFFAQDFGLKDEVIKNYKIAKKEGYTPTDLKWVYANACKPIKRFFLKLLLIPERLINKLKKKKD